MNKINTLILLNLVLLPAVFAWGDLKLHSYQDVLHDRNTERSSRFNVNASIVGYEMFDFEARGMKSKLVNAVKVTKTYQVKALYNELLPKNDTMKAPPKTTSLSQFNKRCRFNRMTYRSECASNVF